MDLSKLKTFVNDFLNMILMMELKFQRVEDFYWEKGGNAGYTHSFPAYFSKYGFQMGFLYGQ